jgi:hypothetical protein
MKMRQGCELAVLGLALMCVVGATPSEEAIPRKRKTLASIDKSWAFLLETHNSSVPLGGISKDGTVGRRQIMDHGYNVDGTPPASFIVGEVSATRKGSSRASKTAAIGKNAHCGYEP